MNSGIGAVTSDLVPHRILDQRGKGHYFENVAVDISISPTEKHQFGYEVSSFSKSMY